LRTLAKEINTLRLTAAIAIVIILSLAPAVSSAQAIRVTDDVGKTLVLAGPPKRIISLAPNITEILFALGLGDRIIGVTRYCDYPPAAQTKEKIGGFLDPDIERIKALAPDVVVAFRGNPLSVLSKLEEIGVPLFILDIKNEIASVPHMIERIGAATGRMAEADRLNAELARTLDRVTAALAPVRETPRVFLSLEGMGLWTFGRDSYFNDLLAKAKGVSVTAAIDQRWFEYGREALIRDDPDVFVVLAGSEANFRRAADWFRSQTGLRDLKAVRTGRILFLDQNAASRFGPRLYDALAALARLLHPDRF
jgi:iron complex transport system substrate-binding protein